jgi:RES domain-containing protein
MIVYRLAPTKFANDLTGEGARLFGGRWNHPGIACLYSSESRALAVLEYSVNTGADHIPPALSIITIETGTASIEEIPESVLPPDWKSAPAPSSTKDFGSAIIKSSKAAIIKIPSAIITSEHNFLLNPTHPDARMFKILELTDFHYDLRIKE